MQRNERSYRRGARERVLEPVPYGGWVAGREVSCRIVLSTARALQRRGVPLAVLEEGLPEPLARMRNLRERTSWTVWCRMTENARRILDRAQFVALGSEWFRWPGLSAITYPARFVYEPSDVYRWLCRAGNGRAAPFHTLPSRLEQVDDDHLDFDIWTRPGFEVNEAVFLITAGGLEYLPRLVGLRPAIIEMLPIARGYRYRITLPSGRRSAAWVRRVASIPAAALAAARELDVIHEEHQERYHELRHTEEELQRQATRLAVANSIAQVVHLDLDLARTAETVARALVERGGFATACVHIDCAADDGPVSVERTFGAAACEGQVVEVTLTGRSGLLGSVKAWPSAGGRADRELLVALVPTIEIALENANVFRELSEYGGKLERRVEERTAELSDAKDRLEATLTELRTAQAGRDRIFANINHEIRTPLTLILAAVGSLRAGHGAHPDGSPALRSLSRLEHATDDLLRMIDALLLLAAGQEGGIRLARQTTDVCGLLRELVDEWAPVFDTAGIATVLNGDEECSGELDPRALRRALENLLGNAAKFTPRGGRVEIRVTSAPDDLWIEVTDTGPGFHPEVLPRLFERFVHRPPDANPAARGTGLGLAVVSDIVHAHGGRVTGENRTGGGALVRVVLPRGVQAEDRTTPAPHPAAPPRPPAAQFSENPPCIVPPRQDNRRADLLAESTAHRPLVLLVEDEPDLAAALAELLDDGYRVLTAPDGMQGLALARERAPDVLITDVRMPGMDGFELVRRFRELPVSRLVPVIFLTALGEPTARLQGFASGGLDYVVKPVQPAELLARVDAQLRFRAMAVELEQSERLRALGVLTAGLAHELRNPVNALVNGLLPVRAQLPAAALEVGQPAREMLDVMTQAAHQVRKLCDQLLGFVRPGALRMADERIEPLVARARALAADRLENVQVEVTGAVDAVACCAGPFVVQAIVVLLENAADAMSAGGSIALRWWSEGEWVKLEVRDSGPGVPHELASRIFDPFFTTKDPGKGTGLGLAVARRTLEEQGGSLRLVRGGPGAGFELTLPAVGSRAYSAPRE